VGRGEQTQVKTSEVAETGVRGPLLKERLMFRQLTNNGISNTNNAHG